MADALGVRTKDDDESDVVAMTDRPGNGRRAGDMDMGLADGLPEIELIPFILTIVGMPVFDAVCRMFDGEPVDGWLVWLFGMIKDIFDEFDGRSRTPLDGEEILAAGIDVGYDDDGDGDEDVGEGKCIMRESTRSKTHEDGLIPNLVRQSVVESTNLFECV